MKSAILFLILIVFVQYSEASQDRVIQQTIGVEQVQNVRITGHVGEMRVSPHSSEELQLELTLVPERGKHPRLEDAELKINQNGKDLELTLDLPFDNDDIEEKWEIRLPERLALTLKMGVGDVEVDGINGGLDLDVGVGSIRANIAGGGVEGTVGVGDLKVKSSTESYGDVELKAGVGDTRLTVNGHKVNYSKAPGPGNRVELEGSGRDKFELKTNVGNAELEID